MRERNLFASVLRNRELVWEMAIRDLKGANKGALIGWGWLILSPLIQVSAYVFIVSYLFNMRPAQGSGPTEYAMYVLLGMAPWQFMARSLQEATSLIRDRIELVKQVIYPIETLPATSMIVSAAGPLVTLGIGLVIAAWLGKLGWTHLLLPVPVALLVLLVLGSAWIFSIAGIVLKDLREMVTIAVALLVFISPVVLTRDMVGDHLWSIILLNPLSHVIICFRDVFDGEFHATSWIVFVGMTAVATTLGRWVINRTKLLINEYI